MNYNLKSISELHQATEISGTDILIISQRAIGNQIISRRTDINTLYDTYLKSQMDKHYFSKGDNNTTLEDLFNSYVSSLSTDIYNSIMSHISANYATKEDIVNLSNDIIDYCDRTYLKKNNQNITLTYYDKDTNIKFTDEKSTDNGSAQFIIQNVYQYDETNYSFIGWLINGYIYNPGYQLTLTSSTSAYAQFNQIIRLTYNANGGINPPESEQYIVNDGESHVFTLKSIGSMHYAGYEFTGWSINGRKYQENDTIELYSSSTAYAQWSAISENYITISYHKNTPIANNYITISYHKNTPSTPTVTDEEIIEEIPTGSKNRNSINTFNDNNYLWWDN